MDTTTRINQTKEQLQTLRYEVINLEQILMLLTSLETRKTSFEHQ